MLLGTFENKLDDKQRLTIPSKMRNQLGNIVFISKGFEGSLEVRSAEEYDKWINKILIMQTMNSKVRLIQREILGNSAEAEIDNSGRIKIPSNILNLAEIKKDVIVVGVGSRIELWNKKRYDEYFKENASNLEEVANELSEI